MVKITNPIDKDLTLLFEGNTYTLGAGVSDKFPAEVAAQWITIYGFLNIEGSDKAIDEVVEQAVEEEVKEEKPKKKAAKKTTKKEDKE